ncbi:hypothetical protein BDZ89DRAFT_1137584 [Hymenopellis radicata]|nr:hypothetical protein BDZ89DRAFT_1137584 [Hymenopellis radicata]
MHFDLPPVRIALHFILGIFSLVLLGLTAARLHYTTHIPDGDPVNGGIDFYDPVVAELLVTTLFHHDMVHIHVNPLNSTCLFLTRTWVLHRIHTIHKRVENRYVYTFRGELIGCLFVLWMFWICGAGVATNLWGNLSWCQQYQPCRILTAMLAFTWMGWIILTIIMVMSIMFVVVNGALLEPMHGRWDPRASIYTGHRDMSTRPNSGV